MQMQFNSIHTLRGHLNRLDNVMHINLICQILCEIGYLAISSKLPTFQQHKMQNDSQPDCLQLISNTWNVAAYSVFLRGNDS